MNNSNTTNNKSEGNRNTTNNKNYSKFIATDNQTLLWKTINKSQLFNELPPIERSGWFKSVIGHIYFERNSYFFDTDSLTSLNKKTIRIMLNDLKDTIENIRMDAIRNNPYFTDVPKDDPVLSNNPSEVLRNKMEAEARYLNEALVKKELCEQNAMMFDMKQKEFSSLIASNTPPQIDFRIKEIDEPIENMDVLIERCMKERNDYIASLPTLSLDGNSDVVSSTEQPVI